MKRRTALFVGSMALFSFLFIGCGENRWWPQQRPETDAERKCVSELLVGIIGNTPRSIAGHDQDWDDAIRVAHRSAEETCCKIRLYEFESGSMTGRFKER